MIAGTIEMRLVGSQIETGAIEILQDPIEEVTREEADL